MIALTKDADRRLQTERVLMRASWLAPADRALVEQVLQRGVRPHQIAAIAGVTTRTIQRRLARLIQRLTDPDCEFILRHHRQWDKSAAEVAIAIWIRGLTFRQAADQLGMTLHGVRQQVQMIRGYLQAARNAVGQTAGSVDRFG